MYIYILFIYITSFCHYSTRDASLFSPMDSKQRRILARAALKIAAAKIHLSKLYFTLTPNTVQQKFGLLNVNQKCN